MRLLIIPVGRDEMRETMDQEKRLIIGISGASGVIYGKRLLELLQPQKVETHLVISKAAELTISYELNDPSAEIKSLADYVHPASDIGANIASGSFKTMGMIIAPCSIRTMSEIATGVTTSLMSRAADVVLKERRKLSLMVRETPLHLGHLRTMTSLAEMGAIIAPPLPALYTEPASLDEMITQTCARVLDLYDLAPDDMVRWRDDASKDQTS